MYRGAVGLSRYGASLPTDLVDPGRHFRVTVAMVFSFIVPVKNELAYTRALVESVTATNPGAAVEWVIVDSGSTDGTLAWCAEVGARVVPFKSTPFNYCAAVNAGATVASGDLWIIANNDLEFRSSGDLSRLELAFRSWPLIGAMSPGRASGAAELEFRYGGLNGACWVVRPEALRSWGGMPEAMSGYGYDEAFTNIQCWRRGLGFAWLTGWDVLHHGSVTFGPQGGNVTPALRRNLSRLLAAAEATDLDTNEHPDRIVQRLCQREQDRAPARIRLPEGVSKAWLVRQGYANAKPSGARAAEAPLVIGDRNTAERAQWLPWLANELLLQPDAPAVGGHGWWAVRDAEGYDASAAPSQQALLAGAKSVGPSPPVLMPPLAHKRATLRQRLSAAVHTWRARGRELPEGW